MRLRARITSLTVAAAIIGAVTACASTAAAQGPRPALTRTATPARTRAPARTSALRPSASPAIAVTGAPGGVKAKGAVVADAATGQMLWARDVGTERPMASVTKVMTALLVLESGHLGKEIRVPQAAFSYAWKYGGETASLRPGDVLTAGELLEALLLPSGADAAYTLANAYGPGLNAFVARMNATAARMGMTHTHFTSPDGLPYPTGASTYSTPSDLLTLGLAAMRYPAFRSIVDQRFYQLPKGPGHHAYWWDNTDNLIGSYQGAVGIKTGYTDDAGHCLLFEAIRNGRTLIGAVLDSPATGPAAAMQDAARMLNWGFQLRGVG
ncbi:MAG TPA: serine hydrolase [Streptosporangiaceae bacterium]|jgi:D-alanyl-D-alanine carboxypeptidase (penicillin-binding protein 5/6)|nr:serine hydrolase [Streptosporangiaceae bacterium]